LKARLPALLVVCGLALVVGIAPALAGPSAPRPLSPADSASVTLPFTISWSAASDPSGILAYNWQVSASSTFAKISRQDSVMAPATSDVVSGLAVGTYFWRVQAVSNDFVQGPWSTARRFKVTGASAGLPATPSLNPPRGGSSFHPWESFGMSWSGVAGATKYVLEAAKDSTFAANGVVFRWESPTPSTEILITTVDRGTYSARVFAVDANGNYSMPSNVVGFTIAFNAPIAAAPTLVSPTGGATAPLPIEFRWNHVVNPQSSGYQLQIARDSGFTQIEQDIPFLNGPTYTVAQLPTAGAKFWRVRSFQGVIDTAGTAAVTAWSPVGTFVVPDGPLQVNAISLSRAAPASGQEVYVDLQLNKGAPAGGATINLASSNAQAAPLPASVAVPGGVSFVTFRFVTGQVETPTTVTMTATIGSVSTTKSFTVSPSSLQSLDGMPFRQNGGVQLGAIVMLDGQAPAGGAVVSLSSSSPAAQPPPSVTVPAGVESVSFTMPTSQVSADTPVTITATWRGASVQATTTLMPQPAPTSITLDPTTTSGSSGSFGRVTAADPRDADVTFSLSTSRPDLVTIPNSVTVPQFAAAGGIQHRHLPRQHEDAGHDFGVRRRSDVVGDADPGSSSRGAKHDRAHPQPVHGHLRRELDRHGHAFRGRSDGWAGGVALELERCSQRAGVRDRTGRSDERLLQRLDIRLRKRDDHGDRRPRQLERGADGELRPALDDRHRHDHARRVEWRSSPRRSDELELDCDLEGLRHVDRSPARDDVRRPLRDQHRLESRQRHGQKQPRRRSDADGDRLVGTAHLPAHQRAPKRSHPRG
jgi:hypothetical protein